MVIFEDLYLGENVVASHTNINDEGQTVTFGQPEIGTTATIDGEKTAQPFEQIIITDTVEYSGLTVGQEYTLKGVMMNKETGELLVIGEDEEQAQVTFAATFTPAESNGTVDVLFTFDASTLVGKSVVVFETLFQGESEITSHENIEDEGQTVTVAVKEATTVEFYSQLLRGKITSHKTGAEQVPLEGVTFGLFDVEATEFIAEDALATTETDANGRFSFEASYGSFQVMELATLPGYLTMEEPVVMEVNTGSAELEPISNNQTIIHIPKVDAETGEELPGATIELYVSDGTLLDIWETSVRHLPCYHSPSRGRGVRPT